MLFLCTHNSARSLIAEALLRHRAGERYRAWNAGLEPGRVHPVTLLVLQEAGIDTSGLESKGLDTVLGKALVQTAIVARPGGRGVPASVSLRARSSTVAAR